MPKITVVTPTTNGPYLQETIDSVLTQTHKDIEYIIVADGVKTPVVPKDKRINVITLPFKTGIDRWNGHRIYGATPFLANGEYIIQLDEDDLYMPEHLESLLEAIQGYDVSYSLRMILNRDGTLACLDSCESLGKHMGILGDHLIGVGSLLQPVKLAVKTSQLWYAKAREPNVMEVDRALTKYLLHNHSMNCSYEHTMGYRMGNTENSVKAEFFFDGNKRINDIYNGQLPWLKHK
jgi:glycosyltransferase involved in cell wall biosynthesis